MITTLRRQVIKQCPYKDETDAGELVITIPGEAPELHDLAARVDAAAAGRVSHEEFTRKVTALCPPGSQVTTTWHTGPWRAEVREGAVMRYFANPSTPGIREAMRTGLLGMIATPAQGNLIPAGAAWCADNGCFGDGYPGDDGYLEFLAARRGSVDRCAFAVAPDVPMDMRASLARSAPMLGRIRALGFHVALAAQNGIEDMAVPWDSFDVLFIGGDTAWKLGPAARRVTRDARARGKRVHMGRVNSLRRLRYADAIGCDSADGTFLAFGPDVNLPELLGWLRAINDQQALWEAS